MVRIVKCLARDRGNAPAYAGLMGAHVEITGVAIKRAK
jgi:hypothetical protein